MKVAFIPSLICTAGGVNTVRAATFAYTSTAFPMLTGTLVTMFGFVPVGFAKSSAGSPIQYI